MNLKKMCASQNGMQGTSKSTFFSKIYIGKYIYNYIENIIRNIKIYYFYFIFNIKITDLFLSKFLLQNLYNFQPKKHVKIVYLFARRTP